EPVPLTHSPDSSFHSSDKQAVHPFFEINETLRCKMALSVKENRMTTSSGKENQDAIINQGVS
ncbi:MAG: hypothetical protein IKE03_08230, partial [Blautia sp.]|nr:hypothetical protein [Blautia sp.]